MLRGVVAMVNMICAVSSLALYNGRSLLCINMSISSASLEYFSLHIKCCKMEKRSVAVGDRSAQFVADSGGGEPRTSCTPVFRVCISSVPGVPGVDVGAKARFGIRREGDAARRKRIFSEIGCNWRLFPPP